MTYLRRRDDSGGGGSGRERFLCITCNIRGASRNIVTTPEGEHVGGCGSDGRCEEKGKYRWKKIEQ
jgi:hypothetical protein